jgi:cation diffusion facilitator family transporter
MGGESLHRFFVPLPIQFNQAIGVAVVGLVVNLGCAFLLKGDHHHRHCHEAHGRHHHDHQQDFNLRAAYVHVLADAVTSVTAIIALIAGKFLGWLWLDAVMGIVGSAIVSVWAYGLIRDTSGILLDRTPECSDLPDEIRRSVESDGDSLVTDLHVWQIGVGKFSAIVSIVAHEPKQTEVYRALFQEHEELVHVTVETNLCDQHKTLTPA